MSMSPEQIAVQQKAQLDRLSDEISKVTQGFTEFLANVNKAREMLANPLVISAITNLTDQQLVEMGSHAKYQAQWFRDALTASMELRTFLNGKLDPADENSPSLLEVFYRVKA